MTLPRFGKVVPLQGDMPELAGYVLSRDPRADVVPKADEERIEIMRRGRASLAEQTGRDFGYDLAEWVRFLKTDPEHRDELTHPYAYSTTLQWLRQAMADPDRQRLVSMTARADKPQPDS